MMDGGRIVSVGLNFDQHSQDVPLCDYFLGPCNMCFSYSEADQYLVLFWFLIMPLVSSIYFEFFMNTSYVHFHTKVSIMKIL